MHHWFTCRYLSDTWILCGCIFYCEDMNCRADNCSHCLENPNFLSLTVPRPLRNNVTQNNKVLITEPAAHNMMSSKLSSSTLWLCTMNYTIRNNCLSTGVRPQSKISADLPSLTPQQHTHWLWPQIRGQWLSESYCYTTTQKLSVCACVCVCRCVCASVFAPFLTALKKKRGLVSFH